ncbi:glycosyltransferase family protein [Radicibacter daui]|uniref:glycosyltransferase family protein n=1 Tax=Radicibacter daui TaxID=3064829 RepID=UPI004046C2E0
MALRILNVGNYHQKHYGVLKTRNTVKFHNGLIRLGHNVMPFSDRDVAKTERHLFRSGRAMANKRLLETCEAFDPDLILIGHADTIDNKTLLEVRRQKPSLRIAFWCLDALFVDANRKRLLQNAEVADALFITSGGEALRQFKPRGGGPVCFTPPCCDRSLEPLTNFQTPSLAFDALFCGVGEPSDPRVGLMERAREALPQARIEIRGILGAQAAWGLPYERLLAQSKALLNLNRHEGEELYSSDRIAQGFGNGLAVILSRAGGLQRLIGEENAFFFDGEDELHAAIQKIARDDAWREVARRGWETYTQRFSSEAITAYIIKRTLEGGPDDLYFDGSGH